MNFAEHHKEKTAQGLDKAQAKANLFAIADLLDRLGIRYFLFFGTLLGAVREQDFIAHDTDTDLGVFGDFSRRFPEIRAGAEAEGFTILRGETGGFLFSFLRGNEYLDCYVSEPCRAFPYRRAYEVDSSVVPARHLDSMGRLGFLGRDFPVPTEPEKVLARLYGPNWRVPVRRAPAKPSLGNRIRRFLREKDKLDALRRHLRIKREGRR